MNDSICGLDCTKCDWKDSCGGCAASCGSPFGGGCVLADCCSTSGRECKGGCFDGRCLLKKEIIAEINALGIEDMPEVTDLDALKGSYVNVEYPLPNGQKVKFWEDDRIILGNQLEKRNSDRCYGIAVDENYLLICEYGEGGSDAEIVVYKKRSKKDLLV